MKLCSKCQAEKSEVEFYQTSGNRCKRCHNKDSVERAKRNPQRNRELSKRWYYATEENRRTAINAAKNWQKEHKDRDKFTKFKRALVRTYNLSYEKYCELVKLQDGKCAICNCLPSRNLDVDHDHSCCPTKKSCGKCIRGLLCSSCNTALGLLKDDLVLFEKAMSYLQTK